MIKRRCWGYRQAHVSYPLFIVVVFLSVSGAVCADTLHHELQVTLLPEKAHISVVDNLQFPANTNSVEFSLRSNLTLKTPGIDHEILGKSIDGHMRHYRINRLPAHRKVQLIYQGAISARKTQGPFDMPDAVLGPEGAYLDGSSGWVPRIKNYPWYTFSLNVNLPTAWEVISQGKRSRSGSVVSFNMSKPQDDIYLLGGPYRRYTQLHEGVEIAIYLLTEDSDLASSYLDASAKYISLYSDWIGHYPYAKFAVVENRWQTGYGMPSFTLLGSRVIRLPFILYTSLPHEIVHNWWGNGVYVDYSGGNWSEGLTAYMSDHFSDEQRGKASEYRRKALERYANYAARHRDFALADFRSRHDEASQAVGYSKSMMLFHMLRRQAGDDSFNHGIRQLWQRYRFKSVDFPTVIEQLHTGNEDESSTFAEQWLQRPGAPELSLEQAAVSEKADGYVLTVVISQKQAGPVYDLQVPVKVTLDSSTQAHSEMVSLSQKRVTVTLKLNRRPLAVSLDPDYDIFRLLHPLERPSSLGRLFGSGRQILVLPSTASAEQTEAWRQLAAIWSRRYNNVETVNDEDLKDLPADAAVWLLGWENILLDRYRERFSSTSRQVDDRSVTIDNEQYRADDHAVVILDADNSRTALGFIGAYDPGAIAQMARKLPHYSSYGVLAFTESEGQNIVKQQLQVKVSPLTRQLTD